MNIELDLAEIREAEVIRARIQEGLEETFPSEVVNALIYGESPVRIFRKHRGMTATDLANRIGVSASYLSQIENKKKSGSIEVLKAIANELGLSLDDLV